MNFVHETEENSLPSKVEKIHTIFKKGSYYSQSLQKNYRHNNFFEVKLNGINMTSRICDIIFVTLPHIFLGKSKFLYRKREEEAVYSWCKSNNWTEPRKLENGMWVAFPPMGVIETPIPVQKIFLPKGNKLSLLFSNFIGGLLLLVCAIAVGLVAVCITPYFWLGRKNY